ncbi:LOW QUALITY PROTEIN: hypothetical protein V2J09_016192, partial [Rumex salicifolius]
VVRIQSGPLRAGSHISLPISPSPSRTHYSRSLSFTRTRAPAACSHPPRLGGETLSVLLVSHLAVGSASRLTRDLLGPSASSSRLGGSGLGSSSRTASIENNIMKQSKDPFEAAFEEQEESPPDSPVGANDTETQFSAGSSALNQKDSGGKELITHQGMASSSAPSTSAAGLALPGNKNKEYDEEEEEENMDMELKVPSSGDPDKMAKMQ